MSRNHPVLKHATCMNSTRNKTLGILIMVILLNIKTNIVIGIYEYGRGGKCVQMFEYTYT